MACARPSLLLRLLNPEGRKVFRVRETTCEDYVDMTQDTRT